VVLAQCKIKINATNKGKWATGARFTPGWWYKGARWRPINAPPEFQRQQRRLIARSQSVWLQSFRVSSQRTSTYTCIEDQREESGVTARNQSALGKWSSSLGTRVRFNWGVKLSQERVKQHPLHRDYCVSARFISHSLLFFARALTEIRFRIDFMQMTPLQSWPEARAPSICIFISSLMENVNTHYGEI
jgi:hypothetical protein